MRIAFIMRRSGPDADPISLIAAETIADLRVRGARVEVLIADDLLLDIDDLRPAHDLYVLKSKTALTLSLAGALTAAGALVVNSFWSHSLAWDKIASTAALAAAGVPVPPSWATGAASCLTPLFSPGPVWLKPQRGKQGTGVRRLAVPAELAGLTTPADATGLPLPLFAQHEVPSDGYDFKVYAIGEQLWARTRTWPTRRPEDKLGAPAALPPAIRAAALAAGQALGLELYGVDFLIADGQFFVIDVNPFPGYHGVADAPRHLARYIYDRANGRAEPAPIARSPVELLR